MDAKVIKPFHHANSGATWFEGDTFSGDAPTVCQLVARGYLEPPSRRGVPRAEVSVTQDLSSLTVAELRNMCAVRGVAAPKRATKAQLLTLLGV